MWIASATLSPRFDQALASLPIRSGRELLRCRKCQQVSLPALTEAWSETPRDSTRILSLGFVPDACSAGKPSESRRRETREMRGSAQLLAEPDLADGGQGTGVPMAAWAAWVHAECDDGRAEGT